MIKGNLKDQNVAVRILEQSFKDNKSVQYVAGPNIKKIKKLIEYSFFQAVNFGEVFFNDDYSACCLVIDPKKKKTTLESIVWDIKLLFSVIGITNVSKVLKKEKIVAENHPKNKEYIHLWYIGVLPAHQRKGLGGNLLRDVKEYFNKPIYLETSTKENLPFYKKHGFETFNSHDFGFEMFMFKYDKIK